MRATARELQIDPKPSLPLSSVSAVDRGTRQPRRFSVNDPTGVGGLLSGIIDRRGFDSIIVIESDISDLKNAEEEVVRMHAAQLASDHRAQRSFLASMSHGARPSAKP